MEDRRMGRLTGHCGMINSRVPQITPWEFS